MGDASRGQVQFESTKTAKKPSRESPSRETPEPRNWSLPNHKGHNNGYQAHENDHEHEEIVSNAVIAQKN
jgi:hypothetical protein